MKRTIGYINLLLLFLLVFNNCEQQNDFSVLKGPYLGQRPPGITPEIFAPGIVSTKEYSELGCTFSPDGKEFYFSRSRDGEISKIMIARETEKEWTVPKIAPFSGKNIDFEPHISPDGSKMFFNRFDPNDTTIQDGIWIVRRSIDGWGEPSFVGQGMYSTATRDDYVYLTDRSKPYDEQGIVRTRLIDNRFAELEWQEGGVNSPGPDRRAGRHPYISPDESFIIFDSYKKGTDDTGRLFVCFRKKDGSWSEAFDLGYKINFSPNICASLSPDGKYLFFSSRGGIPGNKTDIYWVDAKIIQDLRPDELK